MDIIQCYWMLLDVILIDVQFLIICYLVFLYHFVISFYFFERREKEDNFYYQPCFMNVKLRGVNYPCGLAIPRREENVFSHPIVFRRLGNDMIVSVRFFDFIKIKYIFVNKIFLKKKGYKE